MAQRATIVIDIGKTMAKASLWTTGGVQMARRLRTNIARGEVLDAAGIEDWLAGVLNEFAGIAHVGAIIPVAHGAAAAIINGNGLVAQPVDYEAFVRADVRAGYDKLRAPFAETGSPALPDSLNLGVQLFQRGAMPQKAQILPWPQYWSWLLSGIASSEVSSLGCHTDLWNPAAGKPSSLAVKMGWAEHLAPLRKAGDVLGPITPAWSARTGLPSDTQIHCGVHDSNAALVAARGFPEIAGEEATILSTGTWFIAMRAPATAFDLTALPEARDCLVNLDVEGNAVPSARFMGGREIEVLAQGERIDRAEDQDAMIAALPGCGMILPAFIHGSGPFPNAEGQWLNPPDDRVARLAAIALYAALMTDTALDLIGARQTLLIEGRFAAAATFVRALATLRSDMTIYTSSSAVDVSFGALRLVHPTLKPSETLQRAQPLPLDLTTYKAEWHRKIKEGAAS